MATKRLSIIFATFLAAAQALRLEAQVSYQYDVAGNLLSQSNSVVAAPPSSENLAPQYVGADTNGVLTVFAPVTGTGPLSYQWYFNGVAIAGATNGAYFLTNATSSNLGKYQLVAANSAGAVTSAVVNVSYLDPDGSGLPVAWELAYFGVTGVDPNADPDGDGVSNYLEYLDGTDPTNPNSVRPRLNIPTTIPGGTVSVVPLKPEYELGDVVQVTAMPGAGFFQGWSGSNAAPVGGSFTNQDASLTVVMNSTIWLTPQFPGPVVVWSQGYDPGYATDPESVVPADLSNVVAISAGSLFGLALHGNGTVVAWGYNNVGQLNVPSGLTNVVAIAAEDFSGLALESNGTVVAWGANNVGQTNVPAGLSNVVAITGGGVFGLALENNGTVVGWGDNTYGESTTPVSLSNVVAIAAGYEHSLALTGDGMVTAWGDNSYGETNVPPGLTNVVAIAAGNYFSLALAGNGMLTAWGYNINGQTNVPAGLSNVVAIAAGETFCLALQGNGTLVAWGDNSFGQTNVPPGLSNVVAIAGGGYLSLALLNDGSPFFIRQPVGIAAYSGGTAVLSAGIVGAPPLSFQWQLNGTNVAGATNATLTLTGLETNNADVFRVVVSNLLGTTASASATLTAINAAPIILLPLVSQAVLAGATAVFSVEATGSQPLDYQWQFNGANIAGATQATLNLADVNATDAGNYRVVVSNAFGSSRSSAAVLTQLSSLVVGWGDNSFGEIDVPTGLTNVVAIAGGYGFSLALQGNGTVAAWGYNGDGETNVPAGLSNVVAIAAGLFHCLALESDGTVAAWGNNGYGETTLPAGLSNVVAIAGGEYFSLALQGNGTVVAWGDDTYGVTNVPAGLGNVVAVAAGLYHCLALQGNGTVVAWGDDTYGETNVPPGLSNVVAIAAGASYSLALQKNGTVVAWGYNGSGQTNVPVGLSNVVAIAAGPNFGFSLALQGNGTVVAWGDNTFGETNVPAGLDNVVAIAAGDTHGVALVNNGSPFLARQPVSADAYSGGMALLTAGIVGAPPLSYQWQLNGTNIVGATNATLTVTGLPTNNADVFRVVVRNLLGTATSAGATVTVANSAPIILVPPSSQTVFAGANAAFSVGATGSEPLGYQWQFNGTNIAGATQASLDLADVNATDAGSYRVVVSNAFGTTLTSGAVLTELSSLVVGWGDNTYGETTEPAGLSNVVAIAAGSYFSLALQGSGTVAAWGYNGYGQTNVPAGLSNVVAIAVGSYHCLALQSNGKVVAWGYDSLGQTSVPAGLSSVVAIAGGSDFSLALQANGTVVAWGDNDSGQTTVPVGLSNVVAIAGGGDFSLALQANGTVVAWGDAIYNVPAGLSNVVSIAAGGSFGLALQRNGAVVGWGDDTYGESTAPAGLSNVVSIAAGQNFSLALQTDGTMVAWGNNGYGQINVPAGLSNVVAIAAGAVHSVALVNNGSPFIARQPVGADLYSGASDFLSAGIVGAPPLSYQWQLNGTNIVGATNSTLALTGLQTNNAGVFRVVVSNLLGTATSAGTTVAVTNAAPMILVPPASQSVVSVTGANAIFSVGAAGSQPLDYQWQFNGTNIVGATQSTLNLADVTAANVGTYRVVVSNAFGTALSSGAALTLLNSLVLAWGDNSFGETDVPAGLDDVVAIAGGLDFSLALQGNGKVTAWGDNAVGQANVPAALSSVAAIAAGGYHSLALQSNGTVVAWGNNSFGQTTVPAGLSGVAAIAAGNLHSLAIESNGTVVAWGDNHYGQTNVPPGLSNLVAIAAGQYFSLALQANGTVVAWGSGSSGQTNVPAGLNNVVEIAAGSLFSLALHDNGTVVAWGDNTYGQTNVPEGLSNVVAIAAGQNFSVALEANGTMVAWGDNTHGETDVPPGLSNVVAVTGGATHSLALVNNGSPFIARQPVGTEAYSGGVALLSAGIVGAPPRGYQWQLNGTNIPGATNATLTLPGLPMNNADQFRVVVTNLQGTATSADATVTVVNSAPIILVPPVSQSLVLGANAIFSVGATGSEPLDYQWQFNGTNIAGATQATLDLADVNTNNAGSFGVVVSNAFGTALSLVATLNFTEPTIIVPLQTQTADLGGSATFSVIAAGLGPFSYEWLMNGAIIAGATQSTLSIDNLQASNATTYSVIVSNAYGGVTNSTRLSLVAGPPNDAFVNAIVLTGSSQIVTGSNVNATKEPGEPDDGGNAGGSSVWWTWTAPEDGLVTLDTAGSSFVTLLAVYSGNTVSSLRLIANDDGYGGYRTYSGSYVTFTAGAGEVYRIVVDGYGGATGMYQLSLEEAASGGASGAPTLAASIKDNMFVLSFIATTESNYTIQSTTNLAGGWTTLTNNIIGNGSLYQFTTPVTNITQMFFRVRQP